MILRRIRLPLLLAGIVSLAMAIFFTPPARALVSSLAVLRHIAGTVDAQTGQQEIWRPAAESMALEAEDRVRTGANGRATLAYGPAEVFLKPDSTAVLGYHSVQLREGGLWFRMEKTGQGFRFLTETAAVTIRGTMGRILTDRSGFHLSLLEGVVVVESHGHAAVVTPLHEVFVSSSTRTLDVRSMPVSERARLLIEFSNISQSSAGSTNRGALPVAPRGTRSPGNGGGTGNGSSASSSWSALALGNGVANTTFLPNAVAPGGSVSSGSYSSTAHGQGAVLNGTAGAISSSSSAATGSAAASVGSAVSGVGSSVSGVGSSVSGVGSAVSGVGSAVSGVGSSVAGVGSGLSGGGSVVSGIGSAVSGIGSGVGASVGGLPSVVTGVGSALTGVGSSVTGGSTGTGSPIASTVTPIIQGTIGTIQTITSGILKKLH